MRAQHRPLIAGLVALGLSLALALGEASLRFWSWIGHAATPTQGTEVAGLLEPVPLPLGWRPRLNFSEDRQEPSGEPFVLRTNSHGMRGQELAPTPAPGSRRVLFLGDSYTMALGYPDDKTFVGQVARILEGQGGPHTEVINAGVAGYGTYQELAYYQLHARRLKPHLVVLCVFTGNDFRDNMVTTSSGGTVDPMLFAHPFRFADPAAAPPRLVDLDGAWLPDPVSRQPVLRPDREWVASLERWSLLARLIGSRLGRLVARWEGDLSAIDLAHLYHFYEIGFFQRREDPPFRVARELTLASIVELQRATRDDGAELLLVVLPSDVQLVEAEFQQALAEVGLSESRLGRLDRWYVNGFLERFSTEHGIPHLDLRDVFAGEPAGNHLFLSHSSNDRHLTADGHRVAGEAIAEFLLTRSSQLTDPAVDSHRVAVSHVEEGNLQAAEQALLAGIRRNREWAALHQSLGDLYARQGRSAEARDAYLVALRLDPSSVRNHGVVGDLSLAIGDSASALQSYRTAAAQRPSDLVTREKLVHLYTGLGRWRQAQSESMAIADFLAHLGSRWQAERHRLGNAFYTAGVEAGDADLADRHLRRAATLYQGLLEEDPGNANVLNDLGGAFMMLGLKDEARQMLAEALRIDDQLVAAHENLAQILTEQGNHGDAVAHYRRSSELEPVGGTFFRLGNAYAFSGDLPSAIEAYRQACHLEPDAPDYRYNLAVALASLGEELAKSGQSDAARARWTAAREVLRELVHTAPTYPRAAAHLQRLDSVLR